MAKKNSTKTATKEKMQASEPRLAVFKGWQGINIKESPLGWQPTDTGVYGDPVAGDRNDSNLKANFLVVQNNVDTTSSLALETRHDTEIVAVPPDGLKFTGVACLRENVLFCAFDDNSIRSHVLGSPKDQWRKVDVVDIDDGAVPSWYRWTSIGYYQNMLICLTGPVDDDDRDGEIFTGSFNGLIVESVSNAKTVPEPARPAVLTKRGSLADGNVSRVSVSYTYSNKFGSTRDCPSWSVGTYSTGPVQWHAGCYLGISGNLAEEYGDDWKSFGITGVDVYVRVDENMDAIFAAHADISGDSPAWSVNWLGSLADTSAWTHVSTTVPTENTTKGVNASFFRVHDGRLYFWGGREPYRLWIGGNPGNELSVARGTGGAWVDIEPGNGMEIKGTAKFKTYNGASIVTIMCSNRNSGKVKRYNLLETNLTISNELSTKGYMTEEVANVVGCTSHWGFGAWADGLYTVNRYGLMVTTMAMESNNQLRATPVSDAIEPVFTDILASRLYRAHMIYVNEIVYIIMGTESDGDGLYQDLDRLILCYDINAKAWYTYTYDVDEPVKAMVNIDSETHWEGIGLITDSHIALIPMTGPVEQRPPTFDGEPGFDVIVETGELSVRQPTQQTTYLSQLEFKFDYFVGDLEIVLDGIDYYGRKRTIRKHVHLDEMQRSYPVWMRIDELFESYKLTMRGKARFRLTHFIAKTYVQSYKIDQVYGFTDHSWYSDRHGSQTDIHHYLKSYNNLREAIIP